MVATSAQERDGGSPAGRRCYEIAGLSMLIESDLPITDATFEAKFAAFEVPRPGADAIVVRHHFGLPALDDAGLGREVYRERPWVIYRSAEGFTYLMGPPEHRECVVVANAEHTAIDVFNGPSREKYFREGGVNALTMMPTDQIVLARVLADRKACFLHSCGVVVDGRGLLFVGHSESGKSTMMNLLVAEGEPLCDDRNIVRLWPDGVRAHGCWSHGEVPIVSAASAPLAAMLFLRKATTNRLVRLTSSREILGHLLPCVIKPLVTADWWEKTLDVVEHVIDDVPCYVAEFDKGGDVVPLLRDLVAAGAGERSS